MVRLHTIGCIDLCGSVHTAQRQTSTQIHIGFLANLMVAYVNL